MRRGLLLRIFSALVLAAVSSARADASLEYAVKAAYLPKFANYVEWPAASFDNQHSDISLCIVGSDPFGGIGDEAMQKQQIGGRQIVVKHLAAASRDSGCQILFIGGGDAKKIGQALDAVRGTGVLTVTEAAASGATDSIIRFVIDDNHVRFAIDAEAAAQNGISVSSKLLSLAMTVIPKK
jgi:hypothetical protein